jgi:hypothetical protein
MAALLALLARPIVRWSSLSRLRVEAVSGVVSKYIGETEKNLARILTEASTSNAVEPPA